MTMHPVQSSNIAAVGYEPETQTLTVQFKHGRSYRYANVPEGVFEALKDADSVGSYFANEIKDAYNATS